MLGEARADLLDIRNANGMSSEKAEMPVTAGYLQTWAGAVRGFMNVNAPGPAMPLGSAGADGKRGC
jgi:hypothetical protein